MPQMSPMMWLIFPFIMVALVIVSVTTLNGELNVMKGMDKGSEEGVKELEW